MKDAELPPEDTDRLVLSVSALSSSVFALSKEIQNLVSLVEKQQNEIARLATAMGMKDVER